MTHSFFRLSALAAGLFAIVFLSATQAQAQLPEDFVDEAVISGLNQPISMRFLPDGRALVLQKGGAIVISDPTQNGATSTYMTITNIESGAERGLIDIAIDPNFDTNGYFYLYYSPASPQGFRISRFTHQENGGGLSSRGDYSSEFVVWTEQWPGVENPSFGVYESCCHYGAGLDFGPDGKLYVTPGDKFSGIYAQDRASSAGSIIRINPDGTIPADNPFVGNTNGWDESIWAYGLRNPYRARWDLTPGEERLFVGEVGGNDQARSWEDLHLGEAGANYGWPYCEGPFDRPDLLTDFPNCDTTQYTEPIYAYAHQEEVGQGVNNSSITGGFVYRGIAFPNQYYGAYFFGDYGRRNIRYLTFDPNDPTVVTGDFDFQPNAGTIVALEEGPDGALYYIQISGAVRRIVYDGLAVSSSASPTSGIAPLDVSFDGAGTGGLGSLTYTWDFGDGTTAGPLADPATTHTYTADGVYAATLAATDGVTTSTAAPISIQVGTPPAATILEPTDGMIFRAGDVISFSGETDADPATLEWTVRFGHNDHFHPVLDDYLGTSGTFSIPTSGHDYADDTRYEIELAVTDEVGLTGTSIVTIFPDKVNVTYDTSPILVPVTVDDLTYTPPHVIDELKGFERTISVPETRCVGGTEYVFSEWSDGGAREHTITVPDTDASYTATFVANGDCTALASGLVLHLESDAGLSETGGVVDAWNDLSGSGNDLTAFGDPDVVSVTTPTGLPAVAFDGTGDKLERTASFNNLPAGGDDRTMFVVANYASSGVGGVAYGNNSCGETFGLVVDASGDLRVQRWCNDYTTSEPGTGAGWLLQSAVLSGTTLSHYKDGSLIGSTPSASFNTVLNRFVIGAEIDSSPYLDMDVAAVLLYDRALSASERAQVESYLQDKYLSVPTVASVTITSPTDGATITSSDVTVTWTATAPNAGDHVHLTLDDSPEHVTVMQLDGSYTFTGLSDGLHTVKAEVASSGHTVYPGSDDTVAFTVSTSGGDPIPLSGLVVHLESDLNVTTSGGNVSGWLDRSGNGNDLTAAGDPQLDAAATPSGLPAIAFDGLGDKLERTASFNNLPAGGDDRTMFVVANYSSNGFGGVAYGNNSCGETFGLVVDASGDLAVQRWCSDYTTSEPGTGAGWLLQSAVLSGTTLSHYKDGSLIGSTPSASFNTVLNRFVIGAEIDSSPYLDMDVAAVLLYDRALSASERAQVESYLQSKYLSPGVQLTAYAMLQGAYDAVSGAMRTDLAAGGHLPLSQPFAPRGHAGSETIDPGLLSGSNPPVDWVLLHLRATHDGANLASRAALVLADGQIVDTDGTSPVAFAGTAPGSYYVVVESWNHLAVMSAAAVDCSSGSGSYDFTTSLAQAYAGAGPAMREAASGVWSLWAGDGNLDGQVTAPDFNAWSAATAAGTTGYDASDFNLDGQVTAPDFNLWSAATAAGAQSAVGAPGGAVSRNAPLESPSGEAVRASRSVRDAESAPGFGISDVEQ